MAEKNVAGLLRFFLYILPDGGQARNQGLAERQVVKAGNGEIVRNPDVQPAGGFVKLPGDVVGADEEAGGTKRGGSQQILQDFFGGTFGNAADAVLRQDGALFCQCVSKSL